MAVRTFETEVAGKTMSFEFGKLAGQADGACTIRYGDTVVLATAVMSKEKREGIDFFPLLVDYEERLYAAGKIKGSRFIKREGRPTDDAILTARVVDRSIRPLFDDRMRHDVQVVLTVLAVDQENDPDVVSMVAASCALATSNIPWNGPIVAVRIGRVDGEWVLNPTYAAREKSDIDVVVAYVQDKIMMIEAGTKEVSEDVVLQAIEFGHKHAKTILKTIDQIQKEIGAKKAFVEFAEPSGDEQAAWDATEKKILAFTQDRVRSMIEKKMDKEQLKTAMLKLKDELEEMLKKDNDVTKEQRMKGLGMLDTLYEDAARAFVLETGQRVDGRSLTEIRPITSEVSILKRTHGSALFSRGDTQVLSVVTLGSPGDELFLDTMEETGRRRFMHHYNFPGFSTGEVAPIRSPGRREIGHGALAERALIPILPEKEAFPYTIRVVSEVLSSNGSTSQASVSASSLALMDAGVPIKNPVAGIAIGLMTNKKNPSEYRLLTDIQGVEDFGGDMDFKVAGTSKGITAIQMDIKLAGITMDVVGDALSRSKDARAEILKKMTSVLPAPRSELSPYAPRIYTMKIDPEKIREVIGRGGETINKIIEECGGADVIKIDIEDDGLIMITSHQADMAERAMATIKNLTRELQVGEIFNGTVIKIVTDRNSGTEIGAIVELTPGRDGMVHISQFSNDRIENVSSVVKVGDKLEVKVMGIDKEKGRVELSHKAVKDPAGTQYEERERRPRYPRRQFPRRNNDYNHQR